MNDAELKRAIESLLRQRIGNRLDPAKAKASVVGGEAEEFGPDLLDIPTIVLKWFLDSGLYAFELMTGTPLLVYTGSTLQSYIAGPGTSHPSGSGEQYLIGEAQTADPACYDWPLTAPVLDANQAYPSVTQNSPSKLTQPGNDPVEFTGLMRLAVQAKIGSGRNASELVPSWTMDGDKIGLVRSVDFIYYTIHTDSNGCIAQRLENPPSMDCVRTWLTDYKAGTLVLTDDDAMRLEAWLISSLTVDTTYAQTLLITVAALAPVLSDGRQPLSHGWHYSYDYVSGIWHNACSIVTWRVGPGATTDNYYWESSQAIITFTVSTLSISAVIATPNLDRQIGVYWPVDKLWYAITAAQSQMLLPPSSGTTIAEVGVDVPFYCFYTPGGLQLATISYAEVLPADARQTAQAGCLDCGQTFVEDAVEWSIVTYRGGGFKVGPVTSGIIASTYIGFDESDLGIYGGPSSLSGVEFNTFVSNLLGNPACGYSYELSDFLIDEPCLYDTGNEVVQVTMEWYSQAIFNWYRGNRSGLPRRCVVISGYDPDAVYFVEANQQIENWSNYEANYAQNVLFGYQADLSAGGNTGMKRFQTRYSGICTGTSAGSVRDACGGLLLEHADSLLSNNNVTETNTSGSIQRIDMVANLITGLSGVIPLPRVDAAIWDPFLSGDFLNYLQANALPTAQSYRGDIYYYTDPGTTQLDTGYSAAVDALGYIRWCGFS